MTSPQQNPDVESDDTLPLDPKTVLAAQGTRPGPDDPAADAVGEQTVNLADHGPGATTVDMSSLRRPERAASRGTTDAVPAADREADAVPVVAGEADLTGSPALPTAEAMSPAAPAAAAVPALDRQPTDRPAGPAPEETRPDSPELDQPNTVPGTASPATATPDRAGLTNTGPATEVTPTDATGADVARADVAGADVAGADATPEPVAARRRLSSAGALIGVLIALFGFTLVVQLRNNNTDQGLSTMRQEDLVRILSDLEARETRLNSEISSLEQSQRQLTSGVQGRQAALQEADRRANELGLLAGTLPGRGPGLVVEIRPGASPIKASAVLNTVQELRGAGGEVMQIAGADGAVVRVVASTAFVDGAGGVVVDGIHLRGPYVITVIGAPQTMETALNIPGGVVASVGNAGGTVIAEQRKAVDVTAVRKATSLRYARPVS